MKILQIFNQYRFRGGEEMWVDAIPDLLGDGAEVEELRFHSDDWLGPDAPSLRKQIFLIGNNPESRVKLRERVAAFKPDVLLFHNVIPVGSLGLFEEAKALGLPVWCYLHNFRPFSPGGTLWTGRAVNDAALRGNPWPEICHGAWQGSRIKTAVLAWHLYRARKSGLLDAVDRWIAPSDFMKAKFCEAGVPESKISVVRHCHFAHSKLPAHDDGGHYLFLGRLVKEKGVFDLLNAWAMVQDTLGQDSCPELVIAGDGPEMERLRSMTNGSEHIRFAGFVTGEEKQALLDRCRAMIIPSICWETLGLTAFEAYAVGKPVIAAKSGALQETVIDGETGWHHRAGDAHELARVVMDVEREGAAERRRRGQAGHQWLLNHADPEEWKRTFLDWK